MLNLEFLVIVLLFASVIVCMQCFTSFNKKLGVESYFLADKSLTTFQLSMTFLATQFGGGAIIGACEDAYLYGWHALYYSLGLALGLILLSLGLGAKLRELGLRTVPELFSRYYKSRLMHTCAAIIMTITLFIILIATSIAMRKFLTSLGLNSFHMQFMIWAILIGYTSFGGLQAVVKTDIMQIGFVLVTFFCISVYLLYCGFDFKKAIITNSIHFVSNNRSFDTIIFSAIFVIISQDMGQRCFAAADNITVSKSTFIAAILLILVSIIPVSLGIYGANSGFVKQDSSLIVDIISLLAPVALKNMFCLAALMAIISTLDSILFAVTSHLEFDLKHVFCLLSRLSPIVINFVVGISALCISLLFNDVILMLTIGYKFSICTLCVPYIIAITKFHIANELAALVAAIVGGIVFILTMFLHVSACYAIFSSYIFYLIFIYSRKNGVLK